MKAKIKRRATCILTLTTNGVNIRAEFRTKDAKMLVRLFTTQAMRQTTP